MGERDIVIENELAERSSSKGIVGEENMTKEMLLTERHPGYAPDDVIAGILAYCEVGLFSANPQLIHEAIFDLKKRFPDLLGRFTFSTGDVYPFSPQLERVMTRLQLARIIRMENPDFKTLSLKDKGKVYLQQHVLPRFDEDQRHALAKIAEEFEQRCKVETLAEEKTGENK